ncbi:MAG: cobalamin-binding protein [Proteobacteria bacterium]|nr:cobalamin-binding protein [Pseudomonadota bacterium]MBU1231404.1 cobalamin-binding protein [Pseudomonadota bacterium]MBU1418485.1 cobalamin-binding protein [Pseudomonadota bacterium]MBU1455010.1 cobalamin-binding protein [Pseudomonadota bacterium]
MSSLSLRLVLLLLGSLISLSPAQARLLVDQVGRQVEIPSRPQRIVALMPSITEVVFALGADSRLVGVTQYATTPPAAARIAKVGSYVHLDVERIIRLNPDLCLAVRDGNPKHVVDRLAGFGIPVFVIDPRTLEEVVESIRLLGEALHCQPEAARIMTEMNHILREVEASVAPLKTRPRVFFQIDASPIISAGHNTFIDQLIVKAGGVNLAAGPTPYPRYSWEDVLRLNPEVVIITSMAGGYSSEQLKAGWRKWPQIPAVAANRVHVVDADYFDRPSLRLFEGLRQLLEIIHPAPRNLGTNHSR